jgi:hypothetical protein
MGGNLLQKTFQNTNKSKVKKYWESQRGEFVQSSLYTSMELSH